MSSNSRRAVTLFLVLGFVLSWYPWALHALSHSGNPNPNPLGLLCAALIAAAVGGGRRESASLLKAMVRVRAPVSPWLATFAIPSGALAASAAVAALLGVSLQPMAISWPELLDRFLIAFLFVALGEEPAWRGFLQARLQRRMSVLAATLCVSVVWSIWHAPLMGGELAWAAAPAFIVSVVAAAIVLAWLFNASGGSVLLPMLTHATVNTLGPGLVFRWAPEEQLTLFWCIYAGVWAAIAIALIALTGRTLGYSAASAMSSPPTASNVETAASAN